VVRGVACRADSGINFAELRISTRFANLIGRKFEHAYRDGFGF